LNTLAYSMVICNGPLATTFPANQCGAPDLPSVNVKNIIDTTPAQVKQAIQVLGNDGLNAIIAKAIDYQGLKDLKVTVDRTLVEAFDISFDKNADAIWLAGCWPPQRYAVVSGMVHIPAGQLSIQAAGLDLAVTFRDYWFTFEDLRAEIQCHGGMFILGGMGTSKGSGKVKPESLNNGGSLEVSCASGWGAICTVLALNKAMVTEQTKTTVPRVVADFMNEAHPIPLGPGCPELLRNSFALEEFTTKECCEAPFQVDGNGRLVGGQFNGQPYGFEDQVSSVECNDLTVPGKWAAMCHTVPGEYYPSSLGTACEEGNTIPPAWKCDWCRQSWVAARFVIMVGPLILLALSVFVALVIHRRRVDARQRAMEYKQPAPARTERKYDEYTPMGYSGH